MPLIINNQPHDVPGFCVEDFVSDPSLALEPRWNVRKRSGGEVVHGVTMVVMHSTLGYPDHEHPNLVQGVNDRAATDEECRARRTIANWRKCERFAGAHLVLDADATVYCCADLSLDATFHAGHVNGYSVGIEVEQQTDASFFQVQMNVLPTLVGTLCDLLGIPRRIAMPYQGRPRRGIESESGVVGHRDVDSDRGRGDPGDLIMQALVNVGWTAF